MRERERESEREREMGRGREREREMEMEREEVIKVGRKVDERKTKAVQMCACITMYIVCTCTVG